MLNTESDSMVCISEGDSRICRCSKYVSKDQKGVRYGPKAFEAGLFAQPVAEQVFTWLTIFILQ